MKTCLQELGQTNPCLFKGVWNLRNHWNNYKRGSIKVSGSQKEVKIQVSSTGVHPATHTEDSVPPKGAWKYQPAPSEPPPSTCSLNTLKLNREKYKAPENKSKWEKCKTNEKEKLRTHLGPKLLIDSQINSKANNNVYWAHWSCR